MKVINFILTKNAFIYDNGLYDTISTGNYIYQTSWNSYLAILLRLSKKIQNGYFLIIDHGNRSNLLTILIRNL